MEPFALICTTCKSRLKVRDAAAIGQIMACPKCGGMVLVKPPEVSSAGAARANETGETRPDLSNPLRPLPSISAADALPLREDAFDAVDELLGNVPSRTMVPTPTVRHSPAAPPPAPQPRLAPPLSPPQHAVIKPVDSKVAPDSQAATLSQNAIPVSKPVDKQPAPTTPAARQNAPSQRAAVISAAAAGVATPGAAAAHVTPAPQEATIAPSPAPLPGTLGGSPWQYWAMVSASGLLGVVLAVIVVAVSISWFSKPTAPNAPPLAQNLVNPETPPVTPEQPPVVSPTPPTPADNEVVVNVPPVPADIVKPPNPGPPPKPSPPPMPQVESPPTKQQPADRDPLGLTDPPPTVKPLDPSDDPLSKFNDILGGGPTDPMPAEIAPPAKSGLPPIDEEPPPAPSTEILPKPEPRQIDVAARLADPLPAIEITASPLADFLQVMQDLSTVPITLRPDGLAMVRSTPFNSETPVSWKGSATTVGDAIKNALQPLGLEAKVEADQLVIDVASPQLMTTRLAVKDLTGSDEQHAAELGAMLMAFVSPDSWSDEEDSPMLTVGKEDFTVRQHRPELAQCVLLLEKLRIARGLRPASRFDPRLFELATRSEQAKGVLAAPITLNYSIPTPLLRITDRLGKDAKVRILIDWQSLAGVGWNPDAEATLTVEKQTFASALTDLTRRMELTWRIVDARTVQILSLQAFADRVELEFYPVKDLAADDAAGNALVAKIRTALGGQAFRDAGGRGELRFDAVSKCLVASLTQSQQQQLAALLLTQRDGASASK